MFKEKDIITVKTNTGFDIYTISCIQGIDIYALDEKQEEFLIKKEDIISIIGESE